MLELYSTKAAPTLAKCSFRILCTIDLIKEQKDADNLYYIEWSNNYKAHIVLEAIVPESTKKKRTTWTNLPSNISLTQSFVWSNS